ncbi:MAG: dienelactone hydrolase family protein [Verrucomicrobiales bacterium]|nr:dienelactone hydrolase family protein [Verrucomicrobiales bacterium]
MNLLRAAFATVLFLAPVFAQEVPPPWPILQSIEGGNPLPGSAPLDWEGDLSRKLVEANDRFLDRRIEAAAKKRSTFWKPDHSSPEAYTRSVEENRKQLVEMLGLHRDSREENQNLEWSGNVNSLHTPLYPGIAVSRVRWRAFDRVYGRGLLVTPLHLRSSYPPEPPPADVIVIPDAGQSPEEMIAPGRNGTGVAMALELARVGCRVLVPSLISREENKWTLTNREWLHRPAFLHGRTLTTYELQKILSAVDCLRNLRAKDERTNDHAIGIVGHGEGGWLAMLAAAVDPRIDACATSGSFGPREGLWQGPVERNIFGLLNQFGDAEIAGLIYPRAFLAVAGNEPDWSYRTDAQGQLALEEKYTSKKGKPAVYPRPTEKAFTNEFERFRTLIGSPENAMIASSWSESRDGIGSAELGQFLSWLGVGKGEPVELFPTHTDETAEALSSQGHIGSAEEIAEIDRHNQLLLVDAARVRKDYFKDLKTDSLESFKETIESYREKFRTEVIGDFEIPLAPAHPRTRLYEEGPKTISYEVILDVFDESVGEDRVIAYGILTLPKDLDPASGEKRPVIVCQHGLEGSPQDVIGESKYKAYKAFATRLAERGFITFSPQNGYKYFDLFRLQQFKAQSIGKTLFSIIVPQHRQITKWLAEQPFVDGDKIAFYGLSYGGKSAMRIPPLVDRYCLSICSADFNEWVWKNAATDEASLRYSYANKGEYEIFEWNLGGTFNYAEMAALICPRPFMVERGHFDGVGSDESVAYEYAKVRNLYQAGLGIGDRCEIEWFVGPHSIHGEGTYRFLHQHLDWPE